MRMQFRVLGPLETWCEHQESTPTAPKLRIILALLVLRHNRLVHTAEFISELSRETPSCHAAATLQTYVHMLRKLLTCTTTGVGELLHTAPNGYLASIPPEDIDLHHYERLAEEGRTALARGEVERAADACSRALALWRGPAMAGVAAGELLGANSVRLEESRLRTHETRIEADLQLGRHRELVSELKELTFTHAIHEGFYRQLMIALYRSGRRDEALSEYQRFRRRVREEQEWEPSTRLRQLG